MTTSQASSIGRELMNKYNLQDWSLAFDNAKVRFGHTVYNSKSITLSKRLVELNDIEQVTDTLLHEIAHAIVGRGQGHNRKWRYTAISIGCDGNRTYSSAVVQTPARLWVGTCPGCRATTKRHKRDKIACRNCCTKYNFGKYSTDYLFTWEQA